MTSPVVPPSPAVLAAFGARDTPVRLPGGKGGTWRVGQLIVKPVEFLPETRWRCRVLAGLADSTEFRVARPIRTVNGAWAAGGWEACEFVPGEPDASRPDDVMRAGIAFHTAIVGLARPDFLDIRGDPWSYGDRVAWEELPVAAGPTALTLLDPLARSRRPINLASQVVHGDLLGNVLFSAGLPPAIIDWPAYWRPASWALAAAVADALCWHRAAPDLVARWTHLPEWGQLLVRALIYRIVTDEAALGPAGWTPDRVAAYRPAVTLAIAYAGDRCP